mmetsp:Transcript_17573/g.31797  ORF Transcript_17573/g.31797 Transcript_17573/m.31797 type:complete len:88 (-) Transcript_17573:115-378(-)
MNLLKGTSTSQPAQGGQSRFFVRRRYDSVARSAFCHGNYNSAVPRRLCRQLVGLLEVDRIVSSNLYSENFFKKDLLVGFKILQLYQY